MITQLRKRIAKRFVRLPSFSLEKRQKVLVSVTLLSILFFVMTQTNRVQLTFLYASLLGVLSVILLWWGIAHELALHKTYQAFILPFLFTFSTVLFAFLIPPRIYTHLALTVIFATGVYATFLSENIFVVATERTIPLASSARLVSLVGILVTYFFLSDAILSFRLNFLMMLALFGVVTLAITTHAIWSYTLEEKIRTDLLWIVTLSGCMMSIVSALWFWPTSPTITSLFLAIVMYILVGLSHYWLDRRLFKNILIEYAWVTLLGIFLLLSLTNWVG